MSFFGSGFVLLCTVEKLLLVRLLASSCSDVSCAVMMLTMTMPCAASSLATLRLLLGWCMPCVWYVGSAVLLLSTAAVVCFWVVLLLLRLLLQWCVMRA